MNRTRSKGKKKASGSVSRAKIKTLFDAMTPVQLPIKHTMKTSMPFQTKPIIPSLFQTATPLEDFAPPADFNSPASPGSSAFADLMEHREKLEAALKNARNENDAFDASRKFTRHPYQGLACSATPQNFGDDSAEKSHRPSLIQLKPTEFHLDAPFAQSVKLAADFTDWEKFPLDMIKSEDGVWYTTVPLPPGHYSYRFIVDGEWCDDPRSILRLQNEAFGRANAVMDVD